MSRNGLTVYIVDDDPGFLAAVSRLVRAHGYATEAMSSLRNLRQKLPLPRGSCVLADIMLKGESGLTIPSLLDEHCDPSPVLFMSATDDPKQIKVAGTLGYGRCLKKPFEAAALFEVLDRAVLDAGCAETDDVIGLLKEDP